jgi:ubiquinone/menaquinone biosynthesis C-methylase UbiE
MADYASIYRDSADAYDRMVAHEDVDRRVVASLEAWGPLSGKRVVEVGVGTGRITGQLVSAGATVVGVEPAPAMLALAKQRVAGLGGDPSLLVAGSLDALPFAEASADLAVAGWVFGHQRSFEPGRWRAAVTRGVEEMRRVTRPDGHVVLFETMGTAVPEPGVRADLAELLDFLALHLGFERTLLRTDYAFETADEAAEALRFFFGDAVAERIRDSGWARVPEWTACFVRKCS